jgi:TatD DNase family protein
MDRPPAPEPLPGPVTDTHCHLDMSRDGGVHSDTDWGRAGQALADAAAVNVGRVMQVGTDLDGSTWAVQAADRFETVVAAVALHPNEAPRLAERGRLDQALTEIDRLAASSDRVRAVGETGLDFFRTWPGGRGVQEESFRAHIEIARRRNKALVIHDRDAHEDVLRILNDVQLPPVVIFHCFSGDAAFAEVCVERGWFLSFAGPVTFKNSDGLRDALRVVPLRQVLVETDAPFLTPHPYRGKLNGPYLTPFTVRTVAEVLDVPLNEACEALETNTKAALGAW